MPIMRSICGGATLVGCLLAGFAGNVDAQTAGTPSWMLNIEGTGVFFPDVSGKVSLGGQRVPGASITKPADGTVTFDLGYFITPEIAVDAYVGIPPKAQILGTGPLAPLGTLATTYYGPAILALQYYPPGLGAFHPYVGLGLNYTIFLGTSDRALTNVKVPNAFGTAFEAGMRYNITPRWTFNVDLKYILLSDRISAAYATPAGNLSAVAKTTINPLILGVGIGFLF